MGAYDPMFSAARADVRHQALDPVIVAAPWLLAGGLTCILVKRLAGHRR